MERKAIASTITAIKTSTSVKPFSLPVIYF
jgi:hypothetical protein